MSLCLHIGSAFRDATDILPTVMVAQQRDPTTNHFIGREGLEEPDARVVHVWVDNTDMLLAMQIADLVDTKDSITVHLYGQSWPWLCDLACRADSVDKVDSVAQPSAETHLFIGCMFAGKSTNAIGTVRRLQKVRNLQLLVISHQADNRYQNDGIVSHDLDRVSSVRARNLMDLVRAPDSGYAAARCIIVEEAQFFPDLMSFLHQARADGKHTYVYGLDGTANRQPFGETCRAISIATHVTKLTAMCHNCTETPAKAPFTHCCRMLPPNGVLVGGAETYVAMCRKHWLSTIRLP